MSTTPVAVSKNEFQGDILDREFKIIRNEKGEYFYDYVEKTPEVESALQSIKYLRVKGPLAAVKTAMEARSAVKPGSSPTNNGKAGPKPANTGPKPANTGAKPANTGAKPANTGPKPANTGPKPANTGPKPVNTGPKPVNTGPKPVNTGPKPVNENSASTTGVPNNSRSRTSSNASSVAESVPEELEFEAEEPSKGVVAVVSNNSTAPTLETYCDAKARLQYYKAVKSSTDPTDISTRGTEADVNRWNTIITKYTSGFPNGTTIPPCPVGEVSPPPTPTALPTPSASTGKGGKRRKTKKTKKSKRKTRKYKHKHTRKH